MSVPARLLQRSSILLGAGAVALAAGLVAPVHADPGGQPNGNSSSARDDDGKPGNGAKDPKPGNGPKDPKPGKGPKDPNPGKGPVTGIPGDGDGDGVGAGPGQAPGQPDDASDKQHRVVICKYIRTPGETEVPDHVIVVDYHALEGKGFDGTFPFPFSDGQNGSVAIRWAEKGESAREIELAGCATGETPVEEVPEDEVPEAELPEAETPDGEVGGIVLPGDGGGIHPVLAEEGSVLGIYLDAIDQAAPVTEADRFEAGPGDVLPEAGAPAGLRLAALLGGLLTILGVALLVARRRAGFGA